MRLIELRISNFRGLGGNSNTISFENSNVIVILFVNLYLNARTPVRFSERLCHSILGRCKNLEVTISRVICLLVRESTRRAEADTPIARNERR